MSRGRVGRQLALLGLAVLAWGLPSAGAWAQTCTSCPSGCVQLGAPCGGVCETGCCQRFHCPPPFVHCQERPPCIVIRCGCPRPVCNPCMSPNFGYFQTCW